MTGVDLTKELGFGAISGICGKIIEFPFDTIKVRLQSSSSKTPTWNMISQTYLNEGIFKGFYQGIKGPLMGASLENAVLFTTYNASLHYMKQHLGNITLVHKCISGGISGFVISFILAPIELVKCRLQVINLMEPEIKLQRSSLDANVIKQIIHNDGILGLWKGLGSTLMREVNGTAIWFGTYGLTSDYFESKWPGSQVNSLMCGGLAGLTFNLLTFPVDTVKSNMQIGVLRELNYLNIIRHLGISRLYNGLTITLVRSLPANAVIFYIYELLKNNF